jgi:hypothetical protein
MRAVAGPDNAQPDGLAYHLLVFARGGDASEALRAALDGVGALGWVEARAQSAAEITRPEAAPVDLQPAIARAAQHGCAVIVYDEP